MADHPRNDPQHPRQPQDQHPQADRPQAGEAPGGEAVRSRSADPGQSSYGGFRNEGKQTQGKGHQPGAGPQAGTAGPTEAEPDRPIVEDEGVDPSVPDDERPADAPTFRK